MTPHIRIITRRSDRRIMGRLGESHTLCGGPMTDRDILPSWLRKHDETGAPLCVDCRRIHDERIAAQKREVQRLLIGGPR